MLPDVYEPRAGEGMYGRLASRDGGPTPQSTYNISSSGVLQEVAARYLGSCDMPKSFSTQPSGYTAIVAPREPSGLISSTYIGGQLSARTGVEAQRSETPPLLYVDRAQFSSRSVDDGESTAYGAFKGHQEAPKDDWEEELAAWMRKYGCESTLAKSAPALPATHTEVLRNVEMSDRPSNAEVFREHTPGIASASAGRYGYSPPTTTAVFSEESTRVIHQALDHAIQENVASAADMDDVLSSGHCNVDAGAPSTDLLAEMRVCQGRDLGNSEVLQECVAPPLPAAALSMAPASPPPATQMRWEKQESSRPDPELLSGITNRMSEEAATVLAGRTLLAQNVAPVPTGTPLVQREADRRWDTGRVAQWPKLQWDLAKEPEGQRDIDPIGKYTKRDIEMVTESAKQKAVNGQEWRSTYSESGVRKRDFLQDLQRQRQKDKGAQATGPVWVHMATQAKNMTHELDLQEILDTLKFFTSVRYEDYELYMRLLGEVPRFVAQATALQLCMLVCILARRRIKERNYVDMIASYMLQKLKIADDYLPPTKLVKAANAFASLECRSNQRFVEQFLRHFEHRILELDAELCCIVSPLFVVNYMNDSLRRSFLKRAAEVQAGFQGPMDSCRNLVCMEFALRKEHHSLVSSLPAYVGRYLQKLQQHSAFDSWGSVHILAAHTPNGPKGCVATETSRRLQQKASTAEGGKKVDVHSSAMHQDVSACLTHLGIDHDNGVLCGPYLLDCVAVDMINPAKRIVYEVNGPHHFYEGTNELIAEKKLRHRMLSRLGQKLHMINAEDWIKLTSAQKMTFMLGKQHAQQDTNDGSKQPSAVARPRCQPGMTVPTPGGGVPRVPPPPPRLRAARSVQDKSRSDGPSS